MPYTGIVLTILAFHAAAFLILLGHWLASAGMFPKAAEAFAEQYQTRPIRATLLGIFTYGPLFLLLLNSGNLGNPLLKLIAIVAGFGAVLLALIGTSGLALRIGRNLSPDADSWAQSRRGGVALALVFITPALGSLFLMHIGLASGFGALLLARPWKRNPTPEPSAPTRTGPPPALTTSRREFLVTGLSAVALSAAIFRSVQGRLGQAAQYAGLNLARPLDGPLTPPGATHIDPVAHLLNRFTFGPVPGDHARVTAIGIDAFLDEQLAPGKIHDGLSDRAIARFSEPWWEPLGEAYEESAKTLTPILRRVTLLRAIYSKRQLFEVMCGFWSDHFNIDPGKGDCRFTKIDDDRGVIRSHALGSFREMLRASALSPAMLWYFDGRANTKLTPDERPNENYARELMELHSLGVHGGYTQGDVMEVARCLTGWTILAKKDDGFSGDLLSPFKDRAKVVFRKEAHDDGPKRVLGQDIPAGLREGDLDRVIDIVASHPSTARFIAEKLCIRFISDQAPTPAVEAVAEAFSNSNGDIKSTLRTLIATPEFQNSGGSKFKRPIHFIVSALRATNASTDADRGIIRYLERMGQVPFGYPTPDGYPAAASHWHATLLWRWKFALALSNNRIKGTRIERRKLVRALGDDTALMATLLNRQAGAAEREACLQSGDDLALLLASPAFQRC